MVRGSSGGAVQPQASLPLAVGVSRWCRLAGGQRRGQGAAIPDVRGSEPPRAGRSRQQNNFQSTQRNPTSAHLLVTALFAPEHPTACLPVPGPQSRITPSTAPVSTAIKSRPAAYCYSSSPHTIRHAPTTGRTNTIHLNNQHHPAMSRTWNTDSTSSTRSAEKFGLDDKDTSSILVYKYRSGLDLSSQEHLCKALDKGTSPASITDNCRVCRRSSLALPDPSLRVTRKKIPRGDSRVEVKREDLWNDEEKSEYCELPNSKSGLASVCLPRSVWFKRMLFNQFQDLYIVSPETTPNSSLNGSPESSQCSPSSTWNHSTNSDGAAAQHQEQHKSPGDQ